MIGLKYAVSGFLKLISNERNFRIQFILFLITLFTSWFFGISWTEWLVILIVSALVLSLEAINTSIERLCDLYTTENNESIKWIKDVSAGAVLLASFFAVIVGCIIFIPKILLFLE